MSRAAAAPGARTRAPLARVAGAPAARARPASDSETPGCSKSGCCCWRYQMTVAATQPGFKIGLATLGSNAVRPQGGGG